MKIQADINHIVITGGGTAGWITAGLIAVRHLGKGSSLSVTLVESPTIKTIGVGEGTWPSMRQTLSTLGISEKAFLSCCDASFKQGSQFVNWAPNNGHEYYHPFSLPATKQHIHLSQHWLNVHASHHANGSGPLAQFADAVDFQSGICRHQKAPKTLACGDFHFKANYGYHLDAAKFIALLSQHCIEHLNVNHVIANVEQVSLTVKGDIDALVCAPLRHTNAKQHRISGDLFIDCTGKDALLIGKTLQIPWKNAQQTLFNDTALATQVPYCTPSHPITSCTLATAQTAGWIWDIGLQSRRGVGHVYSSSHTTEQQAENTLRAYASQTLGEKAADALSVKKIHFSSGYREQAWCNNCIAVGMSSGFIEPLEASALVMIELAANAISDALPRYHHELPLLAKRYNKKFTARWQQIIEFLKLHYVASQRTDSDYWRDN